MSPRPEVWALIPARGGSKGIPRKNLLPLAGMPLIHWSIDHALRCPEITRIWVSTDDPEIAEVARRSGAEVPFLRPAQYSGDGATDLDVFRHALTFATEAREAHPELLVHLRPTGPVRDPGVIRTAIRQMLDAPEADALRSVSLVHDTPYKMWTLKNGALSPLLNLPGRPEAHSAPRQELPPVYIQNGYVDVIRPRTILEMNSMCGRNVLGLVTEQGVTDLDLPHQIPAAALAVEEHKKRMEAEDDRSTKDPTRRAI